MSVHKPKLEPEDLKHPGVLITAHSGAARGRTTGKHRLCKMEGCTGLQVQVQWKKGRPTWECTKALEFKTKLCKLLE